MHEERLRCWRVHYLTVTLVLIVIYPSEFISLFRRAAIDNGSLKVQAQLRTAVYYMFLSGVYHQPNSDAEASEAGPGEPPITIPYGRSTSGYFGILFLCILERVCLSWLENRFGCDEEAYCTIDHFQQRIRNLEKRILKIQSQIKDAPLLVKRAKMRARRASQARDSDGGAASIIEKAARESLAFSSPQDPSLVGPKTASMGLRSPAGSSE